jgi:hypothetical protein
MIRSTRVFAAVAVSVLLAAVAVIMLLKASSPEKIDLDVSLDLWRDAKADCAGPWRTSCNISYELEIVSDGPEGFYQYRCWVDALNDDGHAVKRNVILPVSRTEILGAGQPPYTDACTLPFNGNLLPKARRSITTLTGSCDAFRLVGEPID